MCLGVITLLEFGADGGGLASGARTTPLDEAVAPQAREICYLTTHTKECQQYLACGDRVGNKERDRKREREREEDRE